MLATCNQERNEYPVITQGGADIFGVRLTGTRSIIGAEFRIAGLRDSERNQSAAAWGGCRSVPGHMAVAAER